MKNISPSQPVTHKELQAEFKAFEERFEKKLNLRETVRQEVSRQLEDFNEKQEERFQDLKNYMYNLVDSVIMQMKEMQAEHTAQTLNIPAMRYELEDHEDRIGKLEIRVADKKR